MILINMWLSINVEDHEINFHVMFLWNCKQGGDLRYCQKCSHYKPPRAHHCRVCKRCVLRMVCMIQIIVQGLFLDFLDNDKKCCLLVVRITIAFG